MMRVQDCRCLTLMSNLSIMVKCYVGPANEIHVSVIYSFLLGSSNDFLTGDSPFEIPPFRPSNIPLCRRVNYTFTML